MTTKDFERDCARERVDPAEVERIRDALLKDGIATDRIDILIALSLKRRTT